MHHRKEKAMTKKLIIYSEALLVFFLALIVLRPTVSLAATDTMINQSFIELVDGQENSSGNTDSNEKESSGGKYPKTSEIQTFILSFMGTMFLLSVFLILIFRRRRRDESE